MLQNVVLYRYLEVVHFIYIEYCSAWAKSSVLNTNTLAQSATIKCLATPSTTTPNF